MSARTARALRPGAGETVPSTVALAGVTLAAAVGMGRLFRDSSYLGPLVVAGVVSHATALFMRRRLASLPASELATAAAVSLTIAWVALPQSTWFGVPGPATLEAALEHLGHARSLFSEVVAPAPVNTGFLIAGMAGVGVVAFLADWAAFRLEALFHAVLPSLLLFVFTALLGTDRHQALMVLLYLGAVAAFLLLHQGWLRAAANPWLAGRSSNGLRWRLGAGTALGLAAVLTGMLVGPRLSGADDPASRQWRSSREDQRTTVSPLADIRGRLVDQSDEEVFTVEANARSYWRLTSLDTFDGQVWSSDARHRRATGLLRPGPGGGGERVVQDFTIASLSSTWLPAAYRPERVDGVEGVGYNAALDSLVGPEPTTDGVRYRVESSVPRLTADQLRRAAPPTTDRAGLRRFLGLPPISDRVRLLAGRVAGDPRSTSPFDQAIALQQFFRSQFTYDLGARPGHDGRALENFLFGSRRGYCEQFAGAYAVMARAVGLPSRVAIGFTPGERGRDGRYHVRALNAHAWPEVYLEGFGWVAFEPTPGRGAPGASYSGVPEAQASPDNPATATTTPPTTEATALPTTAAATAPDQPQETAPSPGQERSSPAWLLLALVVPAMVALVPVAKRVRRHRRRTAAASAAERALVAWAEASESLAQAGMPRGRGETVNEHARRVEATADLPEPAARAVGELAGAAAVASYGTQPVAAEVATRAVAAAATLEAGLKASASRPERLRRVLDPRPLRPSRAVTRRA